MNKKVKSQFLLFYSCVPDVWALHEWCNWLTPSEMISKYSKRYDTVFYKAALNTVPDHFQHDDKEITHIIVKLFL